MNDSLDEKKSLHRRLFRIIGSLLSLSLLTFVAIILISGRQMSLTGNLKDRSNRSSTEVLDEYAFSVGRERVFADLNGSLLAAGTLGIQVLDVGGSELFSDSFRMSSPAISAQDGYAIAYDLGASSIRILNKNGIIAAIESEGSVISASINRNGWASVCSQESGLSKGLVTVYNSSGNVVYRVDLVTGYVLSAELSPDNGSLAILNLTGEGSRITFYNLNNTIVDRVIDMQGTLVLDIRYLSGGEVFAVSTSALSVVGRNDESVSVYEFAGRQLGGYALNDDFVALYLLEHNVGHDGLLVTIGSDGYVLGEVEMSREIASMSASSDYLAVLRSDGIVFFNTSLDEIPVMANASSMVGATGVIALGNGMALLAGDHFASVYRSDIKREE